MANDDLFAGLTVKGKQMPSIQAPEQPVAPSENDDLFQGLSVGGQPILPEHPPLPVSRETRATRELPELGSGGLLAGEDPSEVAKISSLLLVTSDPQEMAQIITSTFPHIGVQQDEGGNILLGNNRTGARVVVNKPGMSKLDIMQTLGVISAFSPSGSAATIGTQGAKAGFGMMGRRALQGGAASAGTEATIQAGQAAKGGSFDAGEVATAGALGGVSEMFGPGFNMLKANRQANKLRVATDEVNDVAPAVRQAEEAQDAMSDLTGVRTRLFPGQKTINPAQLQEQSFVASLTPGQATARRELLNQNEEIGQTVDAFLDTIAPPRALETGSNRIRTIAQTRQEALVALRQQRTSPEYTKIFDQAKREGVIVNIRDTMKTINRELVDAPHGSGLEKTFLRIKGMLDRKKGETSNLKRLQNVKFEIDDIIAKSNNKDLQRKLIGIKNNLINDMENASSGYKAVNRQFEELSGPIKRYEESILGGIANVSDRQLKTVSKKLFDPEQTNPLIIRQARETINDNQAWDQIVRTELERRIGSVKSDLDAISRGNVSAIENTPGQLRSAIFGNRKQKRILMEGLRPEQRRNFEHLDTLLSRASAGRPGGSPTATREEIKSRFKRNAVGAIIDFLRQPLNKTKGIGEDAVFDIRVRALARVVYNPNWSLTIRPIENNSEGYRVMKDLLNKAEAPLKASSQLLNEEEQ